MSRTHAHVPYWVGRNRAAKLDPFNRIDHDHRIMPIYERVSWWEDEEVEETRFYVVGEYNYTDMAGNPCHRVVEGTYKKKVIKPVKRFERKIVGYTTGECNYKPLDDDAYRSHRSTVYCDPDWVFPTGSPYTYSKWYTSWGHSLRDEKDEYWGGARSEQRQQQQRWVKEYNSGESLEDTDDYLSYFSDHSIPFWW